MIIAKVVLASQHFALPATSLAFFMKINAMMLVLLLLLMVNVQTSAHKKHSFKVPVVWIAIRNAKLVVKFLRIVLLVLVD